MKSKKRYTILRLAALLCFFTLLGACSSDDDSMPAVTPTETGTFTDADGTVYHWVRIDTLEWMVENYRGGTPWYEQSYVSNGFEESFNVSDTEAEDSLIAHNGNYLTWEDAKASAPKGWRLPTDADYQNLERALGMSAADAKKEGWRNGAANLMMQSGTGTMLNFVLNGQLSAWSTSYVDEYHVGDYGCYWTATRDTTKATNECAFIRVLCAGRNQVQRVACPVKLRWMSVKYVR